MIIIDFITDNKWNNNKKRVNLLLKSRSRSFYDIQIFLFSNMFTLQEMGIINHVVSIYLFDFIIIDSQMHNLYGRYRLKIHFRYCLLSGILTLNKMLYDLNLRSKSMDFAFYCTLDIYPANRAPTGYWFTRLVLFQREPKGINEYGCTSPRFCSFY